MSSNKIEIQGKIASFTDKELVEMLEEKSEEYTEEAIKIAREEIESRGGLIKIKGKIEKAEWPFKMKKRIAKLTDKELVKMLEEPSEKCTDETLQIVREVIEDRGGLIKIKDKIKMADFPFENGVKKKEEKVQTSFNDKSKSELIDNNFNTTVKIGQTISALGWIYIVVTIIVSFIIVISLSGSQKALGVVVLIFCCPFGLLIIVVGQIMQAIISIENNTDKSTKLLEKLLMINVDK